MINAPEGNPSGRILSSDFPIVFSRKQLYFSGFVVQYTKLCHAVSVAIIQEVFYGREQAVYHTIAG